MNKITHILPFLGLSLFLLLLILFSPFSSTSIWTLKTDSELLHSLIIFVFSLIPIIGLFSFNEWKTSKTFDKIILASLLVFLTSITFSIQQGLQTFTVFAICAFIYAFKFHCFKIQHKIYFFFFAYFFWHIISLLWTNTISAGLIRLGTYSLFLLIPLTFSSIQLSKNNVDTLFLLFFRFMGVFVLISLCCWVYQSSLLHVDLIEWLKIQKRVFAEKTAYDIVFAWTNYTHPTYNAISYLFGIPIGFYFLSKAWEKTKINLIEFVLYLLTTLLLVVVTQSRIALIGWALMTLIGTAYSLREKKKWLILLSAASAILFVVFIFLFKEKIGAFLSDPIRAQNYETAFYYIKSNPIWGTGVEGIRTVMDSDAIAKSLGYPFANVGLANPHNQFVGDLMQTGIVGLLLVTAIIIYLFVLSIRKKDFLLFSFLLLFFLIMQMEMPFYLPKGTTYFLLFICLLVSRQTPEYKSSSKD